MNNIHNLTDAQRKIRLIPKSNDSKAEIMFDQGAVAEDNRQVLICQEPVYLHDSLLLFTVPHVPYTINLEGGSIDRRYQLMYDGITVNGVYYSLKGVNNYHSSNVFQDINASKGWEQWGNLFPEELANILSICYHHEEGYFYYPAYYPGGVDTVKVLYRNKTNEVLDIKLHMVPDFKVFTNHITTDGLNVTYKTDDNGDIIFKLGPRDESEDWMEAIVQINEDPNWPGEMEFFYIETFHGHKGRTTNYDYNDYFEIDWGDGSPIYKHVWSEHIGSTDRDFTDYYLMVDHAYPAAGEYRVRIRSSMMMEWVWLQGVRRLEKWGKYIGTYVYGLGVPLSRSLPSPFEYYNPEIPSSVVYYQFDDIVGPFEIDMSKVDQHRTFIDCDFGNYWNSMWQSDITQPREDIYLVWSKELETYPQRRINPCDYFLLTFSYDELAGNDLRVVLYDANQSGLKIGPLNSTEVNYISYNVDDVNKTVSIIYDYKTYSDNGRYLFNDLSMLFHLDWINDVNSGKVKLNIKTFNGDGLSFVDGVLVENSVEKLSDSDLIIQSHSTVTGIASDSLATLSLTYDPREDALILHDAGYFSVENAYYSGPYISITRSDDELTEITANPGTIVDFIRIGVGEVKSDTIAIPDGGVYSHYRSPEDTISVKGMMAMPRDLGLIYGVYYDVGGGSTGQYDGVSGIYRSNFPIDSDDYMVNQDGVILGTGPSFEYRGSNILQLDTSKIQNGDDLLMMYKWTSYYSDEQMQELTPIVSNVKKFNPEDALIITMDLNLTGQVAFRIKDGDVSVYHRAAPVAPSYDSFSYLRETDTYGTPPYTPGYQTYIINKNTWPAPIEMIQKIAIQFYSVDGSPIDPTRIEIFEQNLVAVNQLPSWMS